MPHISTFMYCEDAIDNKSPDGNKLSLNNPFIVFRPLFIPSQFSFGVVMGIIGLDFEEKQNLQVKFSSPNDDVILDTGVIDLDLALTIPDKESNLPPEFRGAIMNLNFRNVPLRVEGIYRSDVFINSELLGQFPIMTKGIES